MEWGVAEGYPTLVNEILTTFSTILSFMHSRRKKEMSKKCVDVYYLGATDFAWQYVHFFKVARVKRTTGASLQCQLNAAELE